MDFRPKILWIDGLGAAVAGIAVLLAGHWLEEWYRLPKDLLFFIGVVNVVYASYSLSLVVRAKRPKTLIVLLVVANLTWAPICLGLAIVFCKTASPFGLAHLVGEAFWVGGLACLEWRWRELLRTA